MNSNNGTRAYGKAPYTVVLVHGGPGAAGEMTPVAKRLSNNRGILEPFQTSTSFFYINLGYMFFLHSGRLVFPSPSLLQFQ